MLVEKIYRYFAEIKLFRFFMSLLSFIYRLIIVKKIDNSFLLNKEGIKDMNITDFYKNRNKGISGILRTRDGGYFLKIVIESFIDELDELIIINNKSVDNTKKIYNELFNKYGNKIKYYEYNYDIIREKNIKTNSINSFSYYSNWSISKASYKTIFKVDDDNLFISNIIIKQIKIVRYLSTFLDKIYYYYWGLNFFTKNEKIGVLSENPYSGRYGDIGFFNISPKTYFIQDGFSEKLITNYFHFDLGFSYIHLKYFKDQNGLKYAPIKLKKHFLHILKTSNLDNVNKYTKKITNNQCINIIKNIISNNH